MKDKCFAVFAELKHQEIYMECYREYATRIDIGISCATSLAAAGSIAGWAIWSQLPYLWPVIIAISQVIQVVKPYFPYATRLAALKYLIPETRDLLLDFEHEWDELDIDEGASEDRYVELSDRYQKLYLSSESKYLGNGYLPDKKRLSKKTEKLCRSHFSRRYSSAGEE